MRIALLLSGQIRTAAGCFESIDRCILAPYKPDVFIDTWWPDEAGTADCDLGELARLYRPVALCAERESAVRGALSADASAFAYHPPETSPYNALCMWRKLRGVMMLLHRHQYARAAEYDLVIRTRFDLWLDEPLPLPRDLADDEIAVPPGWDWRGGLNDLLAIGGVQAMGEYCDVGGWATILNAKLGWFHPEQFLRLRLWAAQINVRRFPLRYSIRGRTIEAVDPQADENPIGAAAMLATTEKEQNA